MTRSGRWRVDVISVGKVTCRSTSAITHQSVQPSSNVGLFLLFLCGVFETFPSLTNCIFVFIHEISLAVSQHIFATLSNNPYIVIYVSLKFRECRFAEVETNLFYIALNMSDLVPKKMYLQGILLHYFIQKKSAVDVHRILVEDHGDHALSETTCRD